MKIYAQILQPKAVNHFEWVENFEKWYNSNRFHTVVMAYMKKRVKEIKEKGYDQHQDYNYDAVNREIANDAYNFGRHIVKDEYQNAMYDAVVAFYKSNMDLFIKFLAVYHNWDSAYKKEIEEYINNNEHDAIGALLNMTTKDDTYMGKLGVYLDTLMEEYL